MLPLMTFIYQGSYVELSHSHPEAFPIRYSGRLFIALRFQPRGIAEPEPDPIFTGRFFPNWGGFS